MIAALERRDAEAFEKFVIDHLLFSKNSYVAQLKKASPVKGSSRSGPTPTRIGLRCKITVSRGEEALKSLPPAGRRSEMEKSTWAAKAMFLKTAHHRAREDGKWVSRRKIMRGR